MNKINAEVWSFTQTPIGMVTDKDIYHSIIRYIEEGILKPGEKLPAYRAVAKLNSRYKNSIHRIYKRLEEKGWLEARKGSGTYVALNFPTHLHVYPESRAVKSLPFSIEPLSVTPIHADCYFHNFTTIGLDTPAQYLSNSWFDLIETKNYAQMYQNINQLSRVTALEGADYKNAILKYLNSKRDFMINLNGLEIVLGRSESLQQIFNVLLRPGDVMVNTSPKDRELCNVLNAQAEVKHQVIKMDAAFLPELKKLLNRTKIKAVHLRPQCSYPGNYTLDRSTCNELLCLAKQYGFYIVEEDDYHEFWYDIKPFKPLICQDHNGHVVYCGAFSLISTYLQQTRTIVAAEDFIALMRSRPVVISPFRDIAMEALITDLLESNKLWQSIQSMKREMEENYFAAWMQMYNTMSTIANFNKPLAGLSFWMKFPNDEKLRNAIDYLEGKGFQIPYFPGSQKPGAGVNHIRLGFGTWDHLELQEPTKQLYEKFGRKY